MEAEIRRRKSQHIDICTDPAYSVESASTYLSEIHLLHKALPDLSVDDISTRTTFFDRDVSLPLFILPMTGGTKEGRRLNRELVTAAEEAGIAVGIGSMRVLLEHPEEVSDFLFRKDAPDVVLIANLGAVQLRDYGAALVEERAKELEVDGISIHLNTLHEYFQPDGERDFRDLFTAIQDFAVRAALPVMVKETGFGIGADDLRRLRDAGVRYVDVSGSGGTNWARVEGYRDEAWQEAAFEFSDWGIPLALALLDAEGATGVIASGGVRSGLDVATCLALGAEIVGMALPFIRAVASQGREGAQTLIAHIDKVLRASMLATGCRSISELRRASYWMSPLLRHLLHEYRRAVQ